jgi:hypothetical protein
VNLAQKTSVEVDGVKDYVAHAIKTASDGQVASILVERPGGRLRWVDGSLVTAVAPEQVANAPVH